MTASETLKLIAKQWCTLNSLMKLTNLGRNSALKIRKKIINDLENKGRKLPCGLILMCEVINKLNININYLQNITRMDLKRYL